MKKKLADSHLGDGTSLLTRMEAGSNPALPANEQAAIKRLTEIIREIIEVEKEIAEVEMKMLALPAQGRA